MLYGEAVGMMSVRRNPASASNARNSPAVRYLPSGETSISKSRILLISGALMSLTTILMIKTAARFHRTLDVFENGERLSVVPIVNDVLHHICVEAFGKVPEKIALRRFDARRNP